VDQSTDSGGRPGLRVFIKGNNELFGLFDDLVTPDDHHMPDADQKFTHNGHPVIVRYEPSEGVRRWMAELSDPGKMARTGSSTKVFDFRPDVIITSIVPELDLLQPPETEAVQGFKKDASDVVKTIRDRLDANIFWCNTTTVDSETGRANHHGISAEPRALLVQRLSLALIEISQELGISVIDVDRLLGEAGVRSFLPGEADSVGSLPLIRDETLRIFEDYGYFDDRPITVQVGAGTGGL
jgi:hypothetical protein